MQYVALLRAINVGGRTTTMEKLRNIFIENGYAGVSSYIQSGNILFSSLVEEGVLVSEIENMLEQKLGYAVPVILRTQNELTQALINNPFSEYVGKEGMNLYIGFLQNLPDEILVKGNTYHNIQILNREVYIMIDKNKGQSMADKLPTTKALDKLMTVRNFNTINKLIEKLA